MFKKIRIIFASTILLKDAKFTLSIKNGTEILSILHPTNWYLVAIEFKQSERLTVFNSKIKKYIPLKYPCGFCLTDLQQSGFLYGSRTYLHSLLSSYLSFIFFMRQYIFSIMKVLYFYSHHYYHFVSAILLMVISRMLIYTQLTQ